MGLRIHITGASGTGTSTLARELASALGSQAFDTDDFYWRPSDPPFLEPRPVSDRVSLMEAVFLPRSDWFLSGALHSWGAPAMARVTHVIFLTAPPSVRLARLRQRERRRFGDLIRPGGSRANAHSGFLDWAMRYDEPGCEGRSRAAHEAWLGTLDQPVLRLDAGHSAHLVLDAALKVLDPSRTPA